MRAVVLQEKGGPEVLRMLEVPTPNPAQRRCSSTWCLPPSTEPTFQRMGLYPDLRWSTRSPASNSPAGRRRGERVVEHAVGDLVMGINNGGCYAEKLAIHERLAMKVPAALAITDAGAFPEVFITAWGALVRQSGLTSGRWALVHAGASGVGTAAIQIAKTLGPGSPSRPRRASTRLSDTRCRSRDRLQHRRLCGGGEGHHRWRRCRCRARRDRRFVPSRATSPRSPWGGPSSRSASWPVGRFRSTSAAC